MRSLLLALLLLPFLHGNGQIPKSGIYFYHYCDIEYSKCIGKSRVKIKGNKIWIYAPADLTGIKEGALLEHGILTKHYSGKWTITNSVRSDKSQSELLVWIDFKKKQYWTF